MKANYKHHLKTLAETQREETLGVVRRVWELSAILALHREFGFGAARLKRFAEALMAVQTEFNTRATASDAYSRKKQEMTNIDTAIIQAVKELRAAGIDHREVFDDGCEIIITDENGTAKNIDDFVDRLESRRINNDDR